MTTLPPCPNWIRDWPDLRDWTPQDERCRSWWTALKRRATRNESPASVDLREYLPPIMASADEACAVAQACVWAVQVGQRRATGQLVDLAPGFLQATAERLRRFSIGPASDFRSTLRALARFGAPPLTLWRDHLARPTALNDPLLFGFARDLSPLHYLRLDAASSSGPQLLRTIRSFLAGGFAIVAGATLSGMLITGEEIAFPTLLDTVDGGYAVTLLGYDDRRRIRSSKGALLVRVAGGVLATSDLLGWLPYRFVESGLLADAWVIVRPGWLDSGEFTRPL